MMKTASPAADQTALKIPDKLLPLLNPKRFKIIIGGRGGGKSETVATLVAAMVDQSGCRAVCCREFQRSIKQSVHSLVSRKVREYEMEGFEILDQELRHINGGDVLYQGLARDPEAIKSVDDVEIAWVEEAQNLSRDSIEKLTPSIRGKSSEVWMTANLGSSNDPFSQHFIKPYEKHLRAHGIYEDDEHTIIWINYYDNPWFPPELELERKLDKLRLSTAEYRHKWLGDFLDTVENAIIHPEWFDACVDAHKALGIKPQGIEVVAHDPSDNGGDAKGVCYRWGNIIMDVDEMETGDINEGADWAIQYCHEKKPDLFVWDGDGMGVGLRRQFRQAFAGKMMRVEMFQGSGAVENPDDLYEEGPGQAKTNAESFRNLRAQRYWGLRDKIYATYRAVKNNERIDLDMIISFSSSIKKLDLLRSEICSVPRKKTNTGIFQVMSKDDMASQGIPSPNMADSVMMASGQEAVLDDEGWGDQDNYNWDQGVI